MVKQHPKIPSITIIKGRFTESVPASHEDPLSPGVLKKVLAGYRQIPSGRVMMINWAIMAPGKSFRPHLHEDMTEIFIIVSGSGEIGDGNNIQSVYRSDLIIIPEKVRHEMYNNSKLPLIYIAVGISQTGKGRTVVIA